MTTHLVLDIETIPDPEIPRADESESVPPAPLNQIVTIGCLLLESYRPAKLGIVGEGKDEPAILRDLGAWLERARPTIVTWNGRGFDMPVIMSRAFKHGVPMAFWYRDRNTRYRFSIEGHFDLMDFIADFGATRSSRLDVFAKLVGFPGKVGVDGSQVQPMVFAGRLREVADYCLCDVVQTTAVLLRLELLRGAISRESYVASAEALLEFIDREPRVEAVATKVDRDRFCLRAASSSSESIDEQQ